MSQATIFLTKTDFKNLAGFIFKNYQATFIPDVNLDKPESIKLSSIADLLRHAHDYPHEKAPALSYFIVSPLWSIEPIYFDFVDNQFLGRYYYALQQYGGPSISLIPRMYGLPNSPADRIISGMIGDYSYYISGSFIRDKINGYKIIKRPIALKNSLNEIKKFIKSNGQKVVYRNGILKMAYAMPNAFEMHEKGVKLMQGDQTFEKE